MENIGNIENIELNQIESEIMNDTNSIDIIKEITKFVSYLKNNENCRTILKQSKIELQNEIEFKQRAEKILKHYHGQDQKIFEEKLMNEQQKYINAIISDMEGEIDKEKLEPINIAQIYQNMLILKMCNINESKHVNDLEDFIKTNKINLKYISKIKREIISKINKLSPERKQSKILDKQIVHPTNTSKDYTSWTLCSNVSRRNIQDNKTRIQPILMRYRNNEDMISHDLTVSSTDDDFIEISSFNNNSNLSKDNEENNSGDVHLILNPFDI